MEFKPNSDLPLLCGRSINGDPHYIPSAEYQGRVIHFCTDFCLNAFKADPERFQSAHSSKPGGYVLKPSPEPQASPFFELQPSPSYGKTIAFG
jgi:YHS domain-containing protein